MDVLLNIRKDLTVKSLLANVKTKEDLDLLMSNKETYALVLDALCRIAENDKEFICCISTRIKQLRSIIQEKFDAVENYNLSKQKEIVLEYLSQTLEYSSKEIHNKKVSYEWLCIEPIKSYREENSYKNFIQIVTKEFDILISQYYTGDLESRMYLERSPSFLVMVNELIRSYGTSLPSELLAYMEIIIKGASKDRLLDHMYTKKFKELQSKTLKNIRKVSGIIEQEKVLSKK